MSPSPWRLAARTERMNPSVIREILKLTEQPGIISLAGGLPSPDTFPVEAMRAATTKVLRDNPHEALQYAASEGYPPLREWVAGEMRSHGVAVDAGQVLITTGSQQGLDLVGKALIDRGSRIAVESPTYLGALQAFTPYEPELAAIDCDDEGPVPEALATQGRGARFLYVLPNFQNPSGRSIGAARRTAIVAAAQRAGVPIVEDNPYGELWFDAEPPAPIASLWREGTVYLGSFSKVLAPGLRLGFAIAPAEVMPKLLQAKQAADLHTPGFNQRLVHEVIKDGFLREHVPTIRAPLQGAARRDAGGAGRAPAAERAARLPLAGAGRRHVLLARAARGHRRRGAAAAGGGARRRLRARGAVLRRRSEEEHPAPVVRDGAAGDDRARRARPRGGPGDDAVSTAFAFTQVDVFADAPLLGNPLAVVHGADALDEARMQAFAQWTNLSETTFLLAPTEPAADYRVRIFTPGGELPFAGHPTLGSCHAWLERGGVPKTPGRAVQQCGVGLVNLRLDGARNAFEAPPLRAGAVEPGVLEPVLRALGLAAEEVVASQWLDNGPRWLGLLLRDAARVLALEPDHAALRTLAKVGVVGPHPAGCGVRLRGPGVRIDGRHRRGPGHRQPQRRAGASG